MTGSGSQHIELFGIESFGVVIGLRGPSRIGRIVAGLLPSARECRPTTEDITYELRERTGGSGTLGYEAWRADGTLVTRAREPEVVAQSLASELHFEIASRSVDYVFVHAGVVGWNDRAIVFPGRSMSGKTTLVAELLRQGATYYSDEYAVFDREGAVHPYARGLRMRSPDGQASISSPGDFTRQIGTSAIPLGVVAVLRFETGSSLLAEPISPGAAALALVDNTVRARDAPAPSIRAASVAGTALNLAGTRGEAEEAASMLLHIAAGQRATPRADDR